MKKRIKAFLRKWIGFFLNPRLLLCVGLAWMVTNGWSYLFLLFGTLFSVPWMAWAGGAWLALLWFPFTPEKILTAALAILFLRLFFPRDTRTLGVLREELARIRSSLQNRWRKKGKKEDFTTHGVPPTENGGALDGSADTRGGTGGYGSAGVKSGVSTEE